MKLACEDLGSGRLLAHVRGELEVRSCTCLENFWELKLAGARELLLDLGGVDASDEDGLATLGALVSLQLERGSSVTVQGAPAEVREVLASLPGTVTLVD